ncbi:hypothetical protein PRIC1_002605 [Phytophthora ramorum]|nr:hypothetical protein KRP22_6242 [Phytophthora ramorum]
MEIQAALCPLGNQRSNRNVVKKMEGWFHRKPIASPHAGGKNQKAKTRSPQRKVSTTSSTETMTSLEDFDGDTDTEEEEAENVGHDADDTAGLQHERTRVQRSNNQAESSSDEECLRYEILLWFGSSLGGVTFASCDSTGYPYVKMTDGNESLPGMWNIQAGDVLVSINDCNVHNSAMDFDSAMQIVASGARPAVLRFRKPTLHELQNFTIQKRKPTSEERLGRRRNRERLEKTLSYVIWREGDGPLGVSLKKQRDSLYPVVADMNRSSVVSRHARIGDQLISINQHDVYKLGSKRWLQLLKSAPKPLVLTFRRLGPALNHKGDRTLDL